VPGRESAASQTPPELASGKLIKAGTRRSRVAAGHALGSYLRMMFSLEVKERWTSQYVASRLDAWEKAGLADRAYTTALRQQFEKNGMHPYLFDFASQVSLTAAAFCVSVPLNLSLTMAGVFSPVQAVIFDRTSAAVIRTAYTLKRFYDSCREGKPHMPWVALAWGALVSYVPFPGLGNGAYLAQLAAARSHSPELHKFLFLDTATRLLQFVHKHARPGSRIKESTAAHLVRLRERAGREAARVLHTT